MTRRSPARILAASDLPVLAVDADAEEGVHTLLEFALPGHVQLAESLDIDLSSTTAVCPRRKRRAAAERTPRIA